MILCVSFDKLGRLTRGVLVLFVSALTVTVYRCDVMARDCSTCLSLRESPATAHYSCQWCGDTCVFNGSCVDVYGSEAAPNNYCPLAHITYVSGLVDFSLAGSKAPRYPCDIVSRVFQPCAGDRKWLSSVAVQVCVAHRRVTGVEENTIRHLDSSWRDNERIFIIDVMRPAHCTSDDSWINDDCSGGYRRLCVNLSNIVFTFTFV